MVAAFCGRLSKEYGNRLDDRGKEYLSLALSATSQMTRLLDDLVDFGRLGLDAARGSKFDANQTVDRVLENFKRFQGIRRQYPRSRLTTRVSGVRFLPEQDAPAFAAFWQQHCDQGGYVDVEHRWNTYDNATHPEFVKPCG